MFQRTSTTVLGFLSHNINAETFYQDYKENSDIGFLKIMNIVIAAFALISALIEFFEGEIFHAIPRVGNMLISLIAVGLMKKFPKWFQALSIINALALFCLILLHIADDHKFGSGSHDFAFGNFLGLLECIFIFSLKKLPIQIILYLILLAFKVTVIIIYNLYVHQIILCVFGGFTVFYVFWFHGTLDRKLMKTLYDSLHQLKNYQSLLNDLPLSTMILKKDKKEVVFKNDHFKKKFEMNGEGESLNFLEKIIIEGSDIVSPGPKCTLMEYFLNIEDQITEDNNITVSAYINPTVTKVTEKTELKKQRQNFRIIIRRLFWGSRLCYAFMFDDISDKEMILALTMADQQKDNVIATVSHELRTPINGIAGLLNLAIERCQDQQQLEYLSHCKNCAKLLLHLVNSILDLSQMRHNKLKVDKKAFNLDEMLDEVRGIYRYQAESKGIELRIRKGKDLPKRMYNDKYRLLEIIINLVGNAIKFTFKGFVELSLEMNETNKELITFCVKDTGIGIKDSDKPKLFNMFGKLSQSDKKINTQGVGLGLTISDQLAKALNAKDEQKGITFQSVYGEGSEFFFNIPFKKEFGGESINNIDSIFQLDDTYDMKEFLDELDLPCKLPAAEDIFLDTFLHKNVKPIVIPSSNTVENPNLETCSPSRLLPATPDSLRVSKRRSSNQLKNVLVVDDNAFNHLAAAQQLRKFDVNIFKALSGQECLKLLLSNPIEFSVILMDIQMPVMDGIETTKKIKEEITKGNVFDVPVVAITAAVDCKIEELVLQCGMVGCYQKPITEDIMKEIMSKYVFRYSHSFVDNILIKNLFVK